MNITKVFLVILSKVLSLFFRSRTIRHILSLTNDEKKEFLVKIINENQKYIEQEKQESTSNNSFKFVQNYNQLPCTIETRKKRADLLEKNGFRDKQILLMGDDDLLSVELAARNFKHVTVLDCDHSLLNKLKILTNEVKYPINYFHIDLYHGIPNYLNNLFDVVCFDPPQNSKDLNIFIESALKAIKYNDSRLYMMINTSALGQKNFNNISDIISAKGFKATNKFEFFNCYPLNKGQSLLLSFVSRFLNGKMNSNKYVNCKYYFTDCYEFKYSNEKDLAEVENNNPMPSSSDNSALYLTEYPTPSYSNARAQNNIIK